MEYYTLRQAAEQLKISKQGLKYWLDRLKIAHEKGESGRYIISSDTIARIRAAREARGEVNGEALGEASSEVVSEVRGEATSEAGSVPEGDNGESEENKEVSEGEVKGEAKGEVVSEATSKDPSDEIAFLRETIKGMQRTIDSLNEELHRKSAEHDALISQLVQKIPDSTKRATVVYQSVQNEGKDGSNNETPTAANEADKPETRTRKRTLWERITGKG